MPSHHPCPDDVPCSACPGCLFTQPDEIRAARWQPPAAVDPARPKLTPRKGSLVHGGRVATMTTALEVARVH